MYNQKIWQYGIHENGKPPIPAPSASLLLTSLSSMFPPLYTAAGMCLCVGYQEHIGLHRNTFFSVSEGLVVP